MLRLLAWFTKKCLPEYYPNVYVSGEIIQVVVKKVMQITKYNLTNIRYSRNCLTTTAVKLYINAMIIPHLTCCMTSWTQAKGTTLKPIASLYKQALKVFNRKPNIYYHFNILEKYVILSLEKLQIKYTDACLMFKVLNVKAPLPLSTFILQKNNRSTGSLI